MRFRTRNRARRDPPTRSGFDIVIGAAGRARELVREILVFSCKAPVTNGAVRVDLLISEATKILRAGIPANIAIVADLARVPEITGNKRRLYQAILNLVTNAAQAIGGGGGTITIGASCDGADSASPGVVRMSVADDGVGIDAATLQRVFEPFFTRRADNDGTGLGVSIVNGIVRAHGGSIAVHSAPGQGTRFDLLFPPRALAA